MKNERSPLSLMNGYYSRGCGDTRKSGVAQERPLLRNLKIAALTFVGKFPDSF